MPAASLKQTCRVTRIEVIDPPANPMPGAPQGTKKIVVTVVPTVPDPTNPMPVTYQYQFDDAAAASGFFDVDNTYELAWTLQPVPAP